MKFPEDFEETNHSLIPNAKQWLLKNSEGDIIMSIVGGGRGLYGDGITTFEMRDYSKEQPEGYKSKEYINKYLSTKLVINTLRDKEN